MRLLAPAALAFNAFIWGVSWWPLRHLQGEGMHPLWATTLIYALAIVVLSACRPAAWREVMGTPALWLIALASGATNAAFNWAVTIGDVVRVVLLFYLMPLWAVLLARALLGERLTRAAALRIAMALGGAAIVLWPAGGGWPLPRTLAEGLAVLGGFTFALNNVMIRRESARDGASRALAMFCGGTLVSALAAATLVAGGAAAWPPPPAAGWGVWILGLALLFLLSNLALQYGAARLTANVTAVIMLSEVFFASASALLLDGGTLSASAALGGALILGAAFIAAAAPRFRASPPLP